MNNFVIPVPDYLKSYEPVISNFGLRFQKYFPYVNSNLETICTVNKRTVESLARLVQSKSAPETTEVVTLLKKKNDSWNRLLKQQTKLGTEILKISAQLSSRLITGIGEPTPVEVGMVFDRNMGIPYIPAPSIKGAVAYAYCVNYFNKAEAGDRYISESNGKIEFKTDEPGFKSLFGARDLKEAGKGGFVFMDAYPVSRPEIVIDIMNPHFGEYYKGNKPPSETDNPVPIKFLAVEKGLTFNFCGYFINKVAKQYKPALFDAFKTAIGQHGLGAKTASGYGFFGKISDKSHDVMQDIQKDKERRELDERKRQEYELEQARRQKEKQDKIRKEEAEKVYLESLESSEGIEKDILLLQKGDLQMAYMYYERYYKGKQSLSDPAEIRLAKLVAKQFKGIPKVTGKKAKKDNQGGKKYAKRYHLEKLLESVKS